MRSGLRRTPESPAYASLLLTYPASWRRSHAEVVLGTLLATHEAIGRDRPTSMERVRFLLDGVRVRLTRRPGPSIRFADGAALRSFRTFDQQNGIVPQDHVSGELEQTRANAAEDRNNDEDRVAAIAMAGMNIIR